MKRKKNFQEVVSSMLLKYLKKWQKCIQIKIKNTVVTVPKLKKYDIIKEAKDLRLKFIKLINKPIVDAIVYEDIIKDKERKQLIFNLGGGIFNYLIVKIKANK